MRTIQNIGLFIAFTSAVGCAASLPPQDLLNARTAYGRASQGPAPQLNPRDMDTAKKQLNVAEASFTEEGDTQHTRDQAYLALRKHGTLQVFLWGFLDKGPAQNRHRAMADIPAETDLSRRISKALKAEGFHFVGPTTMYAFMQSVGMVNDHLVTCHRHAACAKFGKR